MSAPVAVERLVATVSCPRCRGTGEIVGQSRSVGGGAVNDDWDTCPRCHGERVVPVVEARKAEALP